MCTKWGSRATTWSRLPCCLTTPPWWRRHGYRWLSSRKAVVLCSQATPPSLTTRSSKKSSQAPSCVSGEELQRRKRRRLTGKTTASSQLELESNKEGTKLPSDHGSDEAGPLGLNGRSTAFSHSLESSSLRLLAPSQVREAAPSSPGQSEDVEANSPCMGEEECGIWHRVIHVLFARSPLLVVPCVLSPSLWLYRRHDSF